MTTTSITSDRLLRVSEVASMLGISPRKIWRMKNTGELPEPIKLGNSTRWRHSDIVEFINRER